MHRLAGSAAVAATLLRAVLLDCAPPAPGADELGAPFEALAADDTCGGADVEPCGVSLRQLRGEQKVLAPALEDPQADPTQVGLGPGVVSSKAETAPNLYTSNNSALLHASGAPLNTFYVYRAVGMHDYPPLNANVASLAGVLWYLHHEVVIQAPRKFRIKRIIRYKVQTKATAPLFQAGMNFGIRTAFDKGQCTGPYVCGRKTNSSDGKPMPDFCPGMWEPSYVEKIPPYKGPFEWQKYGYFVGCNNLGDFPFPTYPVYYPGAVWYSFPGPCPLKTVGEKSPSCEAHHPGGYCGSKTPTGAGDCTWNYKKVGEITIDEVVGIKDYWPWVESEHREYDPLTDKGIRFDWWDGINDVQRNSQRINATIRAFKAKYPKQATDEEMPPPPCDFSFRKFYHDWYLKAGDSGPCGPAEPQCAKAVQFAKTDGIYAHPDWYPGLNPDSSFEDFQKVLYENSEAGCRRPCHH